MDDLFRRLLADVERTTLIVDSALPPGHVEAATPSCTVIGADNRHSEWSAADQGIAFLGGKIWSYDLIHLATAAFNTLYTAYLERFSMGMLRSITGKPVCVGHVDCYNEPIRLLSFYSQHWIRTSFVFIPPAELMALGSLVSFSDGSRIFSGDPASELDERPHNPAEPVLCLDEKPVVLHADVRPATPAHPGRVARRDNEYKRCGTANVFCAVEPKAGRHFTFVTPDRSGFEFAQVAVKLAMAYPEAKTIHLVMDNLNIHCRKSLADVFGAEMATEVWGRFTVHNTPNPEFRSSSVQTS